MSKGVEIGNIVKRSISLSPQVNQWAEEMAAAKGYQNNFSAFLADLIREARGDATPATRDDSSSSSRICCHSTNTSRARCILQPFC